MTENDIPETPEELRQRLDQLGVRVLEVFYTVVEEEGFTAAAEVLNISQPTVSQHVQHMEKLLGEKLFLRESNNWELTRLGELCYERVKAIQQARTDLRSALEEYYDVRTRNVQLGASTIPGEFLMPSILNDFSNQYPDLCVELAIRDSDEIINQVNDGELRMGIVGTAPDENNSRSSLLFRDEMLLVGSPEHYDRPITPDRLDQYPYVGREKGSGTQQAVTKHLSEQGYDPEDALNVVARLETIQAVKQSVIEGLGVSFLPLSVVEPELDREQLTQLGDDLPRVRREFHLVENKFLGLTGPLRKFKEFTMDWFAREEREIG